MDKDCQDQRTINERRIWVTTIGGIVCGLAGLAFAFIALLRFENVTMSVLGFLVSAVGFGVMTPTEVIKYLPGVKK